MTSTNSSSDEQGSQKALGSYIAQADRGGTAIVTIFQTTPSRPVEPAEVAAAERLFAELPLDGPPTPSGLPPGSVMPFSHNRNFTGRESELRDLARRIKEGGAVAVGQSTAVTGLGGQGKTQLAVEFAFRYGRWFKGGVFFVNCTDRSTIAEAIALGAPALSGNPGYSSLPLPERIAVVGSAWAQPLPRLLIFDNCEDETLLDDWAPKSGGCRLLLTGRRNAWPTGRAIAVLPLGQLPRKESIILLRKHRVDLLATNSDLDKIAEELGDLPLALELAGSYLARYQHDAVGVPATYLAELQKENLLKHISMIEDPATPGKHRTLTDHERDVARTFAVSLNNLHLEDPTDSFARRLLAHAAWLAPGYAIPRNLLKVCAAVPRAVTAAKVIEALAHLHKDSAADRLFANALDRLLNLALVEQTDGTGAVMLHRLVSAFIRMQLTEVGEFRSTTEKTLYGTVDLFLGDGDPTSLRGLAEHLPHVALAAATDGTESALELMNSAGFYNNVVGNYNLSYFLLFNAERYAEYKFGPDHEKMARTLANLAAVQLSMDKYDSAEVSLKRAASIFEATDGANGGRLAMTLVNLGTVQQKLGSFREAGAALMRALEIFEGGPRPDHIQIARTLTCIGSGHGQLGEYTDALTSLRRALSIFETHNKPDHLEIAIALSQLGDVLRSMGNFAEARSSYQRAFTISTSSLGNHHPNTRYVEARLAELDNSGVNKRPWWKQLLRR